MGTTVTDTGDRKSSVDAAKKEYRKAIDIVAPKADGKKLQYVAALSLDGKTHAQSWLGWDAIKNGATLRYELTETAPANGWGTQASSLSESPCAAPGSRN